MVPVPSSLPFFFFRLLVLDLLDICPLVLVLVLVLVFVLVDFNDFDSSISLRSTSGSVTVCKLVLVLAESIVAPDFLCSGPLEVVEGIKSKEKALTQTCEVQNAAAAAAVTVAIDCLLLRLAAVVAVVAIDFCIVHDFLLAVRFGMLILVESISKLYVVKIQSSLG